MEEPKELIEQLIPCRGRLFIVSGPSGVGKDAVLAALFTPEMLPPGLIRCVTATTRAPREGEVHGRDYFFFSREEFEERIRKGWFLEHAPYNLEYYGTPADFVEEQRARGLDVLLKIEVQGALQVRQAAPDAILIFVAPPSWAELERRLRGRGTGDEAEVLRRLAIARREMDTAARYDYLVVNESIHDAATMLRTIILAERCRIAARPMTEDR